MLISKSASKYFIVIFLFLGLYRADSQAVKNAERICGKWTSLEKNMIVEVYKSGNEFRAKIVWFKDDPSKPMDEWRDSHNPDPALRSRKILGMDVVRGLKYDKEGDTWEDGIVYDAQHGKDWKGSAYIDDHGILRVRGYWHFKLFGKTMTFKRV